MLAIETRWFFYCLDVSFMGMIVQRFLRLCEDSIVSIVTLVSITALMPLPAQKNIQSIKVWKPLKINGPVCFEIM